MQYRNIPNLLSFLRIILSFVFAYFFNGMLSGYSHISYSLTVFLIIILTDYLDGHIARMTGNTTYAGALLDVTADFIFVLTAYIVLYINDLLNLLFIMVLLFKFSEFILTSLLFKHIAKKDYLIFDSLGKNVSKFWIAFPGLICILYLMGITILSDLIAVVMSITSILALISTLERVICQRK